MGHNRRKKREADEDAISESENDSFDPLLREIARDSRLGADRAGSVSILPTKGEEIDGKYVIDEILGSGGMGTVFSATQLSMKRRVAIKWMLPAQSLKKESVQRFRREAEAAGRVNHPNVVRVYDTGKHKGGHYLVMELLTGEPLSTLLTAGSVLPYRDAIALLMPVMRGVAAVHAAGVVHRDLKPGNIFLCQSDHRGEYRDRCEPKVLDFGVSKLLAQNNQLESSLTTGNTFLGTPYYIAPEQVESDKKVDCRADVYSLGIVLYELITGQLPFYAKGFSEMLVKITTEVPRPPIELRPEIPGALSDIVMKSIARNPDDRFPGVKAFALALETYAEGIRFEPVENITIMRPTPVPESLKDRFKGSRFTQFSTVALLLVTAAWIITLTLSANREKREPQSVESGQNHPQSEIQTPQNRTVPYATLPKKRQNLEPGKEQKSGAAEVPEATVMRLKSTVASPSSVTNEEKKPKVIKRAPNTAKRASSKDIVSSRAVTFFNSLRATVKVTLKCPDFYNELFVPANDRIVSPVPQQDCQVVCNGKGEPFCAIKLHSNSDSFRIAGRLSR